MTTAQPVFDHLTPSMKLLGGSASFYLAHGTLVGLALIPTVVRVFQMYTRSITPASEIIVEATRVVLALAILAIGRDIPFRQLLSGAEWKRILSDAGTALEAGWVAILIQLGVVLLVVFAFNVGVDRFAAMAIDRDLLELLGLNPGKVQESRDAFIFFVKNALVIPIWVICMLREVEIIGRR